MHTVDGRNPVLVDIAKMIVCSWICIYWNCCRIRIPFDNNIIHCTPFDQSYVLGSKLPLVPCSRDGHQPNSRGVYTHSKDSLLMGGWAYPHYRELIDPGTDVLHTPYHSVQDDGQQLATPASSAQSPPRLGLISISRCMLQMSNISKRYRYVARMYIWYMLYICYICYISYMWYNIGMLVSPSQDRTQTHKGWSSDLQKGGKRFLVTRFLHSQSMTTTWTHCASDTTDLKSIWSSCLWYLEKHNTFNKSYAPNLLIHLKMRQEYPQHLVHLKIEEDVLVFLNHHFQVQGLLLGRINHTWLVEEMLMKFRLSPFAIINGKWIGESVGIPEDKNIYINKTGLDYYLEGGQPKNHICMI